MDPTIAVVYRGDPPFRAEVVENVDRYAFVQPNLTIYLLDGVWRPATTSCLCVPLTATSMTTEAAE